MTRYIVIKTSFTATHHYPEAENYLRFEHRHTFFVTMKWQVSHNNREIEFIDQKEKVNEYIAENYANRFIGRMSCEDIAEELMDIFDACCYVSVFEDDENGAEIIWNRS